MRPYLNEEEEVDSSVLGEEESKRYGAPSVRLSEIRDILQCTVLTGGDNLSTEVETAAASDGMSEVLSSPHPGALLITGLTNIQSVRTADVADICAILYVRGKRPNEKTIQLAREKKIVLIATVHGMFETCGILCHHGLKGVT